MSFPSGIQALVPGGDVWPTCLFSGTELKTINDFLFQSEIDNINLFKVGHQRYPFGGRHPQAPLLLPTCGQDSASRPWKESKVSSFCP